MIVGRRSGQRGSFLEFSKTHPNDSNLSLGASERSMRVIVGKESEVIEGGAKCATASQRSFALFKVGGKVYCLDNQCTHLGGPLCQGSLQGAIVQCPWHGSRFDVTSGNVVGPPARKAVRSYAVAIEDGEIVVEIP